jgi:hypothetical protein
MDASLDPGRAPTDADRQYAVAALRTHAGAGVIDLDRFGDSTAAVLAAPTVAAIDAVFADLPGGPPALPSSVPPVAIPQVPVRVRHRMPLAWARFAPIAPLATLFVAIWAVTGFGYFWPVWPIMGITLATLKGGRCRRSPHWV